MTTEEKFEDIRHELNETLIQTSLSIAHLKALTSTVLGAFSEILSPEQANNLRQNYYTVLEENYYIALSGLDELVGEERAQREEDAIREMMINLRNETT